MAPDVWQARLTRVTQVKGRVYHYMSDEIDRCSCYCVKADETDPDFSGNFYIFNI